MPIYNGTQKVKPSGVAKVYVGTQLVYQSISVVSIALSGQTTTFNVGDTFAFGGTVTATYSNGSTANVTSSTTFSGYNMSVAGTYTVTASYTYKGTTVTASYSITVANPMPDLYYTPNNYNPSTRKYNPSTGNWDSVTFTVNGGTSGTKPACAIIWGDGTNIYATSSNTLSYVLNGTDWQTKTWNIDAQYINPYYMWVPYNCKNQGIACNVSDHSYYLDLSTGNWSSNYSPGSPVKGKQIAYKGDRNYCGLGSSNTPYVFNGSSWAQISNSNEFPFSYISNIFTPIENKNLVLYSNGSSTNWTIYKGVDSGTSTNRYSRSSNIAFSAYNVFIYNGKTYAIVGSTGSKKLYTIAIDSSYNITLTESNDINLAYFNNNNIGITPEWLWCSDAKCPHCAANANWTNWIKLR